MRDTPPRDGDAKPSRDVRPPGSAGQTGTAREATATWTENGRQTDRGLPNPPTPIRGDAGYLWNFC